MGSGVAIKAAIKKYGKENFTKTILYNSFDENDLNEAEIQMIWVERFSGKAEYNLSSGGDSGSRGCKFSELTKRRMSESLRGRTNSEAHNNKISEARKGMVFSEDHCANISLAMKGKGHAQSEDTKLKISKSSKGKTFSKESKRKMSESAKARWSNNKVGE